MLKRTLIVLIACIGDTIQIIYRCHLCTYPGIWLNYIKWAKCKFSLSIDLIIGSVNSMIVPIMHLLMMVIDVLQPLLCPWYAKCAKRLPKVMKRSQIWNTLQVYPRRDSNSNGSDLWSNAPPTRPRRRPQKVLLNCTINHLSLFPIGFYVMFTSWHFFMRVFLNIIFLGYLASWYAPGLLHTQ